MMNDLSKLLDATVTQPDTVSVEVGDYVGNGWGGSLGVIVSVDKVHPKSIEVTFRDHLWINNKFRCRIARDSFTRQGDKSVFFIVGKHEMA